MKETFITFLFSFSLLLMLVATPTPRAFATLDLPVLNVNTGLHYATIHEAINASETLDGHTIVVSSGIYHEWTYYEWDGTLTIDKSLLLLGAGAGLSTISLGAIMIECNNVTLSGFTIQGPIHYEGHSTGFTIRHCSYSNISNNVIKDFYVGVSLANCSLTDISHNHIENTTDGIVLDANAYQNLIRENELVNSTRGVVASFLSTQNLIEGNTFSSSSLAGVYLDRSFNNTVVDNSIFGNLDPPGSLYGIYIDHSVGNNLVGNKVIGRGPYWAENGIYSVDSSYNMLMENEIDAMCHYGAYFLFSDNNNFSNNTVDCSGWFDADVFLNSSSHNTLAENYIHGLPGEYGWEDGISLSLGSLNNMILANQLENLDTGIVDYGSYNAFVGNNIHHVVEGFSAWPYALHLNIEQETILGNNISAKLTGIDLLDSRGCHVSSNMINTANLGLYLQDCYNCFVTGNTITGPDNFSYPIGPTFGIDIRSALDSVVEQNEVTGFGWGISMHDSESCIISSNNLSGIGTYGIELVEKVRNITVVGNNVTSRYAGFSIDLTEFTDNVFFHNNVFNSAILLRGTPQDMRGSNKWDNGVEGNYWAEARGQDLNGDGIFDKPYPICEVFGLIDNYPLAEQWSPIRTLNVTFSNITYVVVIESECLTTGLSFNQTAKQLDFLTRGIEATKGSCNVTFSKDLLDIFPGDQWKVTVNDTEVNQMAIGNETHATIQFSFPSGMNSIRIVGTNPVDEIPPRADAGRDETIYEGTTITLESRNSTDNVAIRSYTWSIADGTLQKFDNATFSARFTKPGTYLVVLNVTDLRGNWATATKTVTVLAIPIWFNWWFWAAISAVLVSISSISAAQYLRIIRKQKKAVDAYQTELNRLPISYIDRARIQIINDALRSKPKIEDFQKKHGVKIRSGVTLEELMKRHGIQT